MTCFAQITPASGTAQTAASARRRIGGITAVGVASLRRGEDPTIKAAVADFYRRHRSLPVELVVHKTLVEQAQAALGALDLPRPPVRGAGGCLIPEVWLGWEDA